MPRIAVYGDIDLNLMDGSAVWLASLVETLSGGNCDVTLFLKAPETRSLLSGRLANLPGITIVPPSGGVRHGRQSDALDQIEAADRYRPFNAIVLRGFALAQEAAHRPQLRGRLWSYVTDIPQTPEAMTPEIAAALGEVALTSQFVLCQTEELRSLLEAMIPESHRRTALLPPMIPPPRVAPRADHIGPVQRIVYAGKFAPLWATLEMVELFCAHRAKYPNAELHVFGDKIHDPRGNPAFAGQMRAALSATPGLTWHRATPRDELLARLPQMDVAWAWRLPQLNESLELSTKLLEYGAAGVPAILCRNDIHEQLLGAHYPLFADTLNEAAALLDRLQSEPGLLQQAAICVRARCTEHTFPRVFAVHLAPLVARAHRFSAAPKQKTILVAGHDLKFAAGIMERMREHGHRVLVDEWQGHNRHDERQSERLLGQADHILSEWSLGNAVWYSRRVSQDQRLVIRFHAQELRTSYPDQVDMNRVARVIFVGGHIRDQARESFGWPDEKLCVVPNAVDPVDMRRPKLPGAQFNLGMLGICPASKGFSRALDLLEELRASDRRYVLYVKGKLPWEYDWLWRRSEERDYFELTFRRIRASSLLARSVVFDAPGADVAAWFRKIGTVLSFSDHESFHLAVAEGAMSGSLPVVRTWYGASDLYPNEWIVADASEAARLIRQRLAAGSTKQLRAAATQVALERFVVSSVTEKIEELLLATPHQLRTAG